MGQSSNEQESLSLSLFFILSLIHWNNFPNTAVINCVSWDFGLLIVPCYNRAQRYFLKSENDRMFSLRGLCACAKRKTTFHLDCRWAALFFCCFPLFFKNSRSIIVCLSYRYLCDPCDFEANTQAA